jgi:signal transduction histidine kinase
MSEAWQRRLGRRRVLLRLYLYGVAVVVLMWLGIFAVGKLIVAPAINAAVRPQAGYFIPRIAAKRDDPATLRAELAAVKQKLKVDVTLYTKDGTLLASNVEPPLAPLPPEEVARLADEPVLELGETPVFAAAVVEGSELVGYGLMTKRPKQLVLRSTWVACLAVLVILAFGTIPVARSIVRPIERLARVTREFGEGKLSARAGEYQSDEIGELARTFDVMADRVAFLLRAEKELLANVSHELRTPLARIRVVLDLASDGDPAASRRYLKEIAEDLAELERLVEDVLTTARLELSEGRVADSSLPLSIDRVDAGELITRTAARFEKRHPSRKLLVDVAAALPTIEADGVLLRRVLENLLENAQKYSDTGEPIELRAWSSEGWLHLEVVDYGIGIPPEDMPRLFQPFFRGDPSRTRRTGGVGLGLALARRIVAAHGGHIGLSSELGAGTTARVRVPLSRSEPPAASG